jgi:tetratricopeptide (TPR) repeat protein
MTTHTKRDLFYLFCVSLWVLSSACSTAKITLLSSPSQAEVYVTALGDHKSKLVGETPLKMTSVELSKTYGGAGPLFLEFKKEGYVTVKTLVTDLGAVDLTVNMELPPASGLEDLVRLNFVVDSIFESQRLAKVGREEDALIQLKAIEKEAPHLAATYELEGGIYYLKKRYKEALDAYTLASNYNPKNPQVVRMRNYLEASLGVRKREMPEPGPLDKVAENIPPVVNASSGALSPPLPLVQASVAGAPLPQGNLQGNSPKSNGPVPDVKKSPAQGGG